MQEAILQGFFELVERDAVGIWWYNRLQRPGLDLATLEQPYVRALLGRYEQLGFAVSVLDLTTDFGIAVFGVIARTGARLIFGFGAHFDAAIALSRALTEANQFLPGALDGTLSNRYGSLSAEPFLHPLGTTRLPPAAIRSDNLLDDLDHAVALVRARGLELLVVDQTRRDVGLPVVKVIIPGMRPFWPRLAPGRLYTVPVTLGWRPRATSEDEMNPVAFFV
jgi:ribosomal protein S12 methylthiotransferase accessory factor